MASLVSPTNSTFSERSGGGSSRPRHSYSLFPTVDATPPTSPTLPQRATFSRTLEQHHRRRSSSLGSAARGSPASRPVSINTSIAQTLLQPTAAATPYAKDVRTGAPHDARPAMTTVHEVHSHASSPVEESHPRGEVRAAAISRPESNSESSQSMGRDTPASSITPDDQSPYHEQQRSCRSFRDHLDSDLPPTPSFQANRFRARVGPNLRIAISRQDDRPPIQRSEDEDDVDGDARGSRSPLPTTPRIRDEMASSTHEQRPRVLLSRVRSTSSRDGRESLVEGANGVAHQRRRSRSAKPLPSIPFASAAESASAPHSLAVYSPPSQCARPDFPSLPPRPSTANSGVYASSQAQRSAGSMSHTWKKSSAPADTVVQPKIRDGAAGGPRSIALPPGVTTRLKTKTSEPMLSSYNFTWKSLSPSELSPSGNAVRPETSPLSRSASSLADRADLPESISRVLAAKAHIAALNISDPNIAEPSLSKSSRSPVASDAAHSRATTPVSLRRNPSLPTFADPAATLKELTEQTEALQLRYTSLRMDRQALSASIISKLQDTKPGPDYHNLLLDEQLSLAAVSSSMDICFAKLKALDCRKEDLVAAMIAQAAFPAPRRYVPSSVPSLVSNASTSSRKYSMGPSTGRLTGEFGDIANGIRLRRLPSYCSDSETSDYQRSSQIRKLSIGSDSGLRPESTDRLVVEGLPDGTHRAGELPLTPVPETTATTSKSFLGAETSSQLDTIDTRPGPATVSTVSDAPMTGDTIDAGSPARKIRINATEAAKLLEILIRSARSGSDVSSVIKSIGGHDGNNVFNDYQSLNAGREEATDSETMQPLELEIYTDPEDPSDQQPRSTTFHGEKSEVDPMASSISEPTLPGVASPVASRSCSPPQKSEAPLPPLPPLPVGHLASCVKPAALSRPRLGVDAADSITAIGASPGSQGDNALGHAKKPRGYSTQTLQTIQVYMDEDVLC